MQINWNQAWLHPWRDVGAAVLQSVHQGVSVCEALNQRATHSPRFVSQSQLPAGQAYEQFIFDTGCCPTRDNAHDFFNGLCWLHFPQTKKRLNQLQAEQIAQEGIKATRGPVRDALTLFDENAAIFVGPDVLWEALQAKNWPVLFVEQRAQWQNAQLIIFGHALLEKLIYPRKPMTAHVYRAHSAIDSIADLDAWVAQDLTGEKLASKPFAPLPVLGVPGWWPENETLEFYDDMAVFR